MTQKIKLKDDSVHPRDLSVQALLGIMITKSVLDSYDSDLVITSLNDGKHSKNSSHYRGDGWDVRTWYIKDQVEQVVAALKDALGKHYFVLLESDHIHINYTPERN